VPITIKEDTRIGGIRKEQETLLKRGKRRERVPIGGKVAEVKQLEEEGREEKTFYCSLFNAVNLQFFY